MRYTKNELWQILICVECGNDFAGNKDSTCRSCGRVYSLCSGRLVLMHRDNSLFPPSAYVDERGGRVLKAKGGIGRYVKGLIPKRSVNLARNRMFDRIAAETHAFPDSPVLVIGSGHQRRDIIDAFVGSGKRFIFCDVDKSADTDLYCDSHNLPFCDASFSGIITTAVLEHVLWPNKVVLEIHRVLQSGGFVYSEVPFLQAVHEGAYDFTRFSMGGHRLLFDKFEEIEVGVVAGSGTALVWALVEFFRSFSSNPKVSRVFGMSAQLAFFWLKYADRFTANKKNAADAASCTFFYGRKLKLASPPANIVARYGNSDFSHT